MSKYMLTISEDDRDDKLSKWVENTVGNGEIARNEQFLLFPQCFQKACGNGLTLKEISKGGPQKLKAFPVKTSIQFN